ncbi:hypothetical protein FS837_004194 [Tulasnella sp. UAMH 9824]|nr:hypothetical protein FS837_004194 [Tulasnella sp. UAMH 9824]
MALSNGAKPAIHRAASAQFELKSTNKTIYISPLDSNVNPIEFPLVNGGEAFRLDSRTLVHVVDENIFAVTLDYNATAFAAGSSSFVRVPRAPYLVGSFPIGSGPTNFKFTGSKKTNVYPDYDLNTAKEQDEEWENRGNSALVYDELFVRHWDEYATDKKTHYFKVLENTEHYTSVKPFGGTDDFDVSQEHIVYTEKDPSVSGATHTVYIIPLKGALVPREFTTGHQGATHSPVFSHDGQWVAGAEMTEDDYERDRAALVLYDLQTNKRWYLTQDWDRSVQNIEFANDGDGSNPTVFVTASARMYANVFSFTIPDFVTSEALSKPKQPKFPTPKAITHSGTDGNVSFTRVERITQFWVKELKRKSLDHGEQFCFRGAEKGRDVQGWVFKPHGYGSSGDVAGNSADGTKKHDKKEKKWPAVFLIHGGPQGAWEDGWSTGWNPNVFAQQGYFVIAVNPTGSIEFEQGKWSLRPSANPTFDYAITLPHPKPDYGVTMPHSLDKMFFLLNRNRAMENGDHTAVEFVCQYLSNFAKQHGLNTKIARDHLVAEYGAPASLLEQTRLKVVP